MRFHILLLFSIVQQLLPGIHSLPLFNRKEALVAGLTSVTLPPEIEQKLTNIAKVFDNRTPDTLYLRNVLTGEGSNKRRIKIPSIGYSLYKTKDKIDECVRLALFNEVAMLDVATQYGTNE